MTTVRAAVVQLEAGADAEANARVAADAIAEAAADGARLVVLPEYSAAWAPRLSVSLAQPTDGTFAMAIRAAARTAGVHVVAGTIEPGPTASAERVRNVAVAIGPDGSLTGRYVKVHLFDAFGTRESDVLAPGEPGPSNTLVFDVDGLTLGVATCYDLRFPEIFRTLVDGGAQAIAVIAAWAAGPGKADQLVTLARARAIENTAYVLLASQIGRGRAGHSLLVDPSGAVLAEADGSEPAVLCADLSTAVVEDVRRAVPSLEHRRYDVVARTEARGPAQD